MIALWFACAQAPRLDAPTVEARRAAFVALDLDGLRAAAPILRARMTDEPDDALRREIVRQAGATGDPAILADLDARVDGPDQREALESLSFDPAGCARLARRYAAERARVKALFAPDCPAGAACELGLDAKMALETPYGRALYDLFDHVAPGCRPALRAELGPLWFVSGEPEKEAVLVPEGSASSPAIPVATRAAFADAIGARVVASGVWRGGGLTLGDGTAIAVRSRLRRWEVADDAPVAVTGVSVPWVPGGDADPRWRLEDVTEVRVVGP